MRFSSYATRFEYEKIVEIDKRTTLLYERFLYSLRSFENELDAKYDDVYDSDGHKFD